MRRLQKEPQRLCTLDQGFSSRVILLTGLTVLSRDICSCHTEDIPGMERVRARADAQDPTVPRTGPQR